MRPKPSRDWVMLELERLGVRVVSGRLGRKAGEEGDEGTPGADKKIVSAGMAGVGASPPAEQRGSLGWGADGDLNRLMAERRTSMGLSFPTDGRRGSLGSLGQVVGLEGDMAQHGLGAGFGVGDAQRRTSSLGLGTLAGGGLGGMGMSVNPNQHYEMLKLHHMNLLNEIQETTLMMNLYQQQQLQQQQQQLQQQASAEGMGATDQLGSIMANQQNNLDSMFGAGQLSQQQRASLGLGTTNFGSPGSMPQGMMQQQQLPPPPAPAAATQQQPETQKQQTPKKEDAKTESTVPAPPPAPSTSDTKRPAEESASDAASPSKRPKTEEDDDGDKDGNGDDKESKDGNDDDKKSDEKKK